MARLQQEIVELCLPPYVRFEQWSLPMFPGVNGYIDHGTNINSVFQSKQHDINMLLELDAIPLNHTVLDLFFQTAAMGHLVGVAQRATHVGPEIYASPAAAALRTDLYQKIGSPSAIGFKYADTFQMITRQARVMGVPVSLYMPKHVETEQWYIDEHTKFGFGTTYECGIFHAFGGYTHEKCIAKYTEVLRALSTQSLVD